MARQDTHHLGMARRRLVLEAPVSVPDDAGGRTETYTPIAAVWAQVRWRSGDERSRAGREEQAARYEIIIRWRAGVNASMRFTGQVAGQVAVYGIVSAGDPDGRRTRLACLCEEISP